MNIPKPYDKDPEKKQRAIELIAYWHATPESMREQKTLAQLAKAHGYSPNQTFYQLSESTEVYHQMLVKVAGKSLHQAPEILEKLAEKALEGHTRSAEIYLNFVRQTITDDNLMRHIAPPQQLQDTLQTIAEGAEEMLALAQQLHTPKEADEYLDAIEADFTERGNSPPESPGILAEPTEQHPTT